MELKGKITRILPLQSGTGKNGTWKKQEFILEIEGKITRKVCFSLWGDKVEQFPLSENQEVIISFDLESREFNGRWYTEAKVWKIQKEDKSTSSKDIPELKGNEFDEPFPLPEANNDDLPF